jgi:hypothetical protein
MQTWHYDGFPTVLAAPNNLMTASVFNDDGSQNVTAFALRPLSMLPATFQFTVTAPGQAKNVLFIASNGSSGRTRLNGFTLVTVPEPSSFVLLLFGATSIALRFRRFT